MAGFEAIEAIQSRLDYLQAVGLGYLELGRALKSLSGGESTRVNLTHVLSTRLVQMLCVLDEPTVGLHPHDTDRLWTAIRSLRDRGNSLILIEHEPEVLRQAEWLIEIGPGAGAAGGEVCFQGPYAELMHAESPTGRYLAGLVPGGLASAASSPVSSTEPVLPVRSASSVGGGQSADSPSLRLAGACGRNLKDLEVTFPLRCLCVVTGVSGSGKSNLVMETLVPAVQQAHGDAQSRPLPYAALEGHACIDRCLVLDASPIPQSSRSNTASYTRCFDDLRQLFAAQPEAKKLGWSIGHFSYNSPQGRCPRCLGEGRLTIDMQFLSDIESICPDCDGTGYGPAALSITYRGRSIADCLALTIEQARPFFRGQGVLQRKLGTLIELGLGYLPLGQRLSTMSAGELQRLKLGKYLAEKGGPALMVMDEPTAGLHFADIDRLLLWLRGCIQRGHSVIVIEHNLQLIEAADHVIDLGPGAGRQGGAMIACGTPAEIARNPASLTGQYLARAAWGKHRSHPSRD
jgi:excinuclease ABC subunit A